ncbi:hypothetical protein B7463_g5781, partial [Scytalidium lignicola]
MARVLQASNRQHRNLLIHDDNGNIVAGLDIQQHRRYINSKMLYRYCNEVLRFPTGTEWAIYRLNPDGSTGRDLRQAANIMVAPGNYIILDQNAQAIIVSLSPETAPRRAFSRSASQSTGPESFQGNFREGLRQRDGTCTISGESLATARDPFADLKSTHIYPVSRVGEWRNMGYRQRWISDTGDQSQIGETGLYSLQNGLLLSSSVHKLLDSFDVGVDPDEGYKVIYFSKNPNRIGGRRLLSTAINASNPNWRVSPDILRWHLRMCLLMNMKGNASIAQWEHDLGQDDMGEILDQPDAAEIMEAELFTRLGPIIA